MSGLDFRPLDAADLAALQSAVTEVLPGSRLYVHGYDTEASIGVRVSITYSTDVTIAEESLAASVEDARALLAAKAVEAAESVRATVERVGILAGAERLVELAKRGMPE